MLPWPTAVAVRHALLRVDAIRNRPPRLPHLDVADTIDLVRLQEHPERSRFDVTGARRFPAGHDVAAAQQVSNVQLGAPRRGIVVVFSRSVRDRRFACAIHVVVRPVCACRRSRTALVPLNMRRRQKASACRYLLDLRRNAARELLTLACARAIHPLTSIGCSANLTVSVRLPTTVLAALSDIVTAARSAALRLPPIAAWHDSEIQRALRASRIPAGRPRRSRNVSTRVSASAN